MNWIRLWQDLPTDPKWRTIAKASGQPISLVIAVYVQMLVTASTAAERGRIEGWNDEDIGASLDVEGEQISAIRKAMQGRVLDKDALTGWNKRQPVRQDDSTQRTRQWRVTQRDAVKRSVTQRDAPEESRGEEIRVEKKRERRSSANAEERAHRIPVEQLPAEWKQWCRTALNWDDHHAEQVFLDFHDYWVAKPGKDGLKLDWFATWRKWCRNQFSSRNLTQLPLEPERWPGQHTGSPNPNLVG